jgi:DNA-binding NarL/FixJ family response regulator
MPRCGSSSTSRSRRTEMHQHKAYALVSDLLLRSKVQALADGAALPVRFFGTPDELIDAIEAGDPPRILVVDLSDRAGAGLKLLERIQGTGSPPTLGFYAHTDDAVRKRALALDVTRVVPRSLLVKKFAELVRETTAT